MKAACSALCLVAVSFAVMCSDCLGEGESVVLWSQRREIELSGSSAAEVKKLCEQLFLRADSSVRLIVSSDRIRAIRTGGEAVEISYPAKRVAVVSGNRIQYSKLLLPIGGAPKDGLIFFAGSVLHSGGAPANGEEDYGPTTFVLNSSGTSSIRRALKAHGLIN